ncbi:universal stress protein [Rhizobium sp. S95]|uniref:Universal stress protein n=1 Tax=Ciceribacter sichuanensis TaxID=2949647 RepID=A0AAJ1BU38_9HYPH|nr:MULTISPECIES: universal stress protein [unclassified Ciceribacter]MCM2397509.1 universal stress protein [Ciceribacter sp. S95]MCM2399873.1 universal stress protein [Ciceribacter sp. S153]MCO5956158.1 universal stress protein [Ciceribacter sp. S101]
MGYKTLLAVLDLQKDAQQITDFSISLAEQFGAHVVGLHAEALAAVPLVAPMEIPDPATVQALQDMAHKETVEVEKVFRSTAERNGTSHEWRSFVSSAGYSAASLIDSARTVDLVVAGQGESGLLSESRADLENFLFESGRPVLLVPYILKQPKPIKRVLIAWNGSREAARATFDALPFLKAAEAVEVFSVDPPETSMQSAEMAGAEIAATLARHGVNVTVVRQESDNIPASAAIENRLSDSSIDLLVMGAYSHKRWWETLFGGVTRTVLDSMTALTLLSR